jgi:isoleucyl-tRNA synthetase
MPAAPGRPASVFLAPFPATAAPAGAPALLARWERLQELRRAVNKALEEARRGGAIGQSLEAAVALAADGETRAFLASFGEGLKDVFIVSSVELLPAAAEGAPLAATVARAAGAKCERCWCWSTGIGASADHPTLCPRCVGAVEAIGGART